MEDCYEFVAGWYYEASLNPVSCIVACCVGLELQVAAAALKYEHAMLSSASAPSETFKCPTEWSLGKRSFPQLIFHLSPFRIPAPQLCKS